MSTQMLKYVLIVPKNDTITFKLYRLMIY